MKPPPDKTPKTFRPFGDYIAAACRTFPHLTEADIREGIRSKTSEHHEIGCAVLMCLSREGWSAPRIAREIDRERGYVANTIRETALSEAKRRYAARQKAVNSNTSANP